MPRPLNVLAFVLLAIATMVLFAYGHDVSHFIFWIVGSRDEPGAWYGFWSGFGGSIPDIAVLTGFVAWYLHHTCHDRPSCLRWGKYEAAGGMFKLCHKHHPDLAGVKPNSDKIKELHNA